MGCGGEAAAARKEGGRRGVGTTDATGGVLADGVPSREMGCGGDGEQEGVMVIIGGGTAAVEEEAGEPSAGSNSGVLGEVGLGADD